MSVERKKFIEMLKEKKLKITRQRLAVLEVLAEQGDRHMTIDDIYNLVREEFPEIGVATVYRTVQLLLEMQLVDRIELNDGCVRYEIGRQFSGEKRHYHHHLVCKSCGKIESFNDDLLEELEKQIQEETGFQIWDHELKFYGICKDCVQDRKNVRNIHKVMEVSS